MKNIGEYYFSSFIAKINGDYDLNDFNKWTDSQKSTVFHEFFHFYQNCSTVYGQINISRICNIVATIHNYEKETFTIPYFIKDLEISEGLFDKYYVPNQDWDDITFFLHSEIKNDRKIEEDIRKSGLSNLKNEAIEYASVCAVIKNKENKENKEFILDGLAICETMIAMIEENLFPKSTNYIEKYPYYLAKKISNEIRNKIKWTNEILIFICDLCLNFFNPGVIFLKFLNSLDENITEIKFSDITNFFDKLSYRTYSETQNKFIEYSYEEYVDTHRKKVISDLKNLITAKYYNSAIDWIENGINSVSVIRKELLSMILEHKKFYNYYDYDWFLNILNLGYPIFKLYDKNKDENEYFLFGKKLKDDVQWAYWYGIESFLNLLGKKNINNIICPFYSNCKNSDKEECSLEPFDQYKNKDCEFQHFMSIFNLENKNIVWNNIV
ncbi:MAG: hypothetical protein ACPKOI_10285 [Pleomorphochaeta sp.]